ncbi:MAG TPA: hypothetical protein VIR27_10070 [Mycobacteriales bacterium]
MAKIKYPEGRVARDQLRDALKRRGRDSVDDIAQGIREHWGYGHLRSYRLALELGQPQVCEQVNTIQGTYAGDPGYFGHQTLSKLERWPTCPRRPTVGQLVALAQVFGTTPRRLVADIDWDRFPPADRVALQALDTVTPDRTTASTTAVGMMEMVRPQAGNPSQNPSTWWVVPEPIGSSNLIERLVTVTNDESTRYADRSGNVGPAALDQLRSSVADLAGRSARPGGATSLLELFGSVRLLRDRIFGFLDGGQPIRERRDLYFLGGAACGLLADLSDQLGYPGAAMSQAQVAHLFAAEAGDPALTAWLYTRQATFCYWNGQPGKARDYARRGAALRPGGTVGVWLPAIEARVAGELGDAEGARVAVHRAAETRDVVQPGTLDGFGGVMSYNRAKQHFYAADAFLGIGDDRAAIAEATAATESYQNGPAEEHNYTDAAIIQFRTALAHVRQGDLDASVESTRAGMQIGGEHRNAHVDKSARRLHQELCTVEVRSAPLAIDTRDQIEDFLSAASPRLQLP